MGGRRAGKPQSPGRRRAARLARLTDRQRTRFYAWEDREVARQNAGTVPFADAAAMVAAIWAEMGLRYPPSVEKLPHHARVTMASANRLSLFLPEQTPAWCLLHELAHAMSSTQDGRSDGHGPIFVGLYVQLLTRYLRHDQDRLLKSLRDANITVDRDAKPIFLDRPRSSSIVLDRPRSSSIVLDRPRSSLKK